MKYILMLVLCPMFVFADTVIFVPGFMGSRLENEGNKLWEPDDEKVDIQKLYMSDDGSSSTEVSTKESIDEIFGINIYKTFLEKLKQWVDEEKIYNYMIFPYDWRLSAVEVARSLDIQKVKDLFFEEKEKTITFIGHSNGGLVIKAILEQWKEAKERGEHSLIDTVKDAIYIGTPHQGAPKAIAALLHGYEQSIPFLASAQQIRQLGALLPGAYGLLPFNKLYKIVDTHSTSALVANFFSEEIDTRSELDLFLASTKGKVASSSDNLAVPISLNEQLLSQSRDTQELLYDSRPGILGTNIIGFGIKTPHKLVYSAASVGCLHWEVSCIPGEEVSYEVLNDLGGDGTVPVLSAQRFNRNKYVNLHAYNVFHKNISHSNLLEAQPVLAAVESILVGKSTTDIPYLHDNYFTIQPEPAIRIKVYSPVEVHVYDENKNHVGRRLHAGYVFIDEEIQGSDYDEFGYDTQIDLPVTGTYDVTLKGTANGYYTLKVSRVLGDEVIEELYRVDDKKIIKGEESKVFIDTNTLTVTYISQSVETVIPTQETEEKKGGLKKCRLQSLLQPIRLWLAEIEGIMPYMTLESQDNFRLFKAKIEGLTQRGCVIP